MLNMKSMLAGNGLLPAHRHGSVKVLTPRVNACETDPLVGVGPVKGQGLATARQFWDISAVDLVRGWYGGCLVARRFNKLLSFGQGWADGGSLL